MTLNEKNFDNYRKYTAFVQPEDLHAAIDDILSEPNLHEIYIQRLNVFDANIFAGDASDEAILDAVEHEFWIQAEYGEKEVFE